MMTPLREPHTTWKVKMRPCNGAQLATTLLVLVPLRKGTRFQDKGNRQDTMDSRH